MANDTTKASLWADADVYYSNDLAATLPADASTPFNASWHQVGLLDGTKGFEGEGKFDSVKDHYGWGGILIATTRSKWKETKTFSILEDNEYTRPLVYPGSAAGEISIPTIGNVKIGFETRNGGKVRRLISKNYAQIETDGKVAENEEDLTTVGLIATIFPDSNKVLWVEQEVPNVVSIAMSPLTLALTTTTIKAVVATATYSDASTGNVTGSVNWSSSVPAKAVVTAGFVSGVSAGVTNVTCSLGGVNSTAPCVVTVT